MDDFARRLFILFSALICHVFKAKYTRGIISSVAKASVSFSFALTSVGDLNPKI